MPLVQTLNQSGQPLTQQRIHYQVLLWQLPVSYSGYPKIYIYNLLVLDVAGTMALVLSQNDFTPAQLSSYLKKISSLITEDFTINNTGIFYNENKTVIDNAIDTGYKVKGRMDQKTLVNILYNYPSDGKENWIYGQSLSETSSLYSLASPLSALLFIITILVL